MAAPVFGDRALVGQLVSHEMTEQLLLLLDADIVGSNETGMEEAAV